MFYTTVWVAISMPDVW